MTDTDKAKVGLPGVDGITAEAGEPDLPAERFAIESPQTSVCGLSLFLFMLCEMNSSHSSAERAQGQLGDFKELFAKRNADYGNAPEEAKDQIH